MNASLPLLPSLALLLLLAGLGARLCRRIGLPGVLAALAAGLIVGPSMLGWVAPSSIITSLGGLGAIALLFVAGLDTRLDALLEVGRAAVLAASFGVALSFLGGLAVGRATGVDPLGAMFLGAALSATSVSVSVEALRDRRRLDSPAGLCVLGAAVIDDVLGVLALGAVVALAGAERPPLRLAGTLVYLPIAWLVGRWALHAAATRGWLAHASRAALPIWLGVLLAYAWMAEAIGGLAPITGAYLLGVLIAREVGTGWPLREDAAAVGHALLIPLFFAAIGLQAELSAVLRQPALGALLFLISVVAKLLGCAAGARLGGLATREAVMVGVGMVPRGEIALIVAGAGLGTGMMTRETFSALVALVFLTTVATPLAIRLTTSRHAERPA